MFKHTDKKDIFVNNIKLNKNTNKQTPNVNPKISAYDKIVMIVTNDNNSNNNDDEAKKNKVHIKV